MVHSDGAIDEPAKNSSSTLSRVSAGSRPSARDSAAIAASTSPASITQRLMASRRPMASRTTSRKVWSAAAVMAIASARPSGPSGARAPSSSTRKRQLLQKLRMLGLVEHGEAGGDIGFERKLVQELRAEGVDGLHFQAAGRLQRAGEQSPRQRPPPGIRARCPSGRGSRRRARHRRAWSIRRACRTRAWPYWRRRPW